MTHIFTSTPAIIIGNWKMNGLLAASSSLVQTLLAAMTQMKEPACEVVICPPAPLLHPIAQLLAGSDLVLLGGQDCHYASGGAYTGEVSAEMLKNSNCRYVILGHSERREHQKESNLLIRKKAESAIREGLVAVICVGESAIERQSGTFISVIETQLRESLPDNATPQNTVIAYEPVWAIGSGKIPTLEEIGQVHLAILSSLPQKFRVIYGGSVKPENAESILSIPYVGGLLVGGCSLNVDDFLHIIQAASIKR